MKSTFLSFRTQLLLSFGSICFIFCGAIFLALYLNHSDTLHHELRDLLRNTEHHYSQLLLNENNFLLFYQSEDDFFKLGESRHLTQIAHFYELVQQDITRLESHRFQKQVHLKARATKELLHQQHQNYLEIVTKLRRRGFKDYGLEGSMRLQVHELENNPNTAIQITDLLMLRRHEKDYLLRKSTYYRLAHKTLEDRILNDLCLNPGQNANDIRLLTQYSIEFQRLCNVINELGNFESNGILHTHKLNSNRIYSELDQLIQSTESSQKQRQTVFQTLFYAAMTLAIGLGILFSFVFASRRARPMQQLLLKIEGVHQDGVKALKGHISESSSEVMKLYEAFRKVFVQLQKQLVLTQESGQKLETRNNELQQVNRELDQFVYSISHDLRAPLTSVMGLVELSKYESCPDRMLEYLKMMEQSLQKLDRFIHDILDFSKNSRLQLEMEQVDLEKIVTAVFEGLNASHGSVTIELKMDIKQESVVYTDQRRITVVLNNLISNAVKYADLKKEQPYVSVQVTSTPSSFKIMVSDNGLGIEDRFKERVFNMFFRASHLSKGSGLGLYIVKETVKILSGTVRLNSLIGQGSTFTLEVPNAVAKTKKTQSLKVPKASLDLRGKLPSNDAL